MEKKLSVAKRNEILRTKAMETVLKGGLEEILLQVSGSKFMVNVEFEGEYIPVRIDFVVPKIDKDDEMQVAEDFAENYRIEQEAKEETKKEKQIAKEKKIARDKKLREKKKAEKEGE